MNVAKLVSVVMVATACASALVAPWPTVRNGYAWLTGDPAVYLMGHGYEEYAQRVLWLGLFLILALLVGATERWLGAAVMLVGIHASWFDYGGPASVLMALVAVGVVCLARFPEIHPVAIRCLALLAVIEALYVFAQWMGVDPLRGSAQVERINVPVGTLGNRAVTATLLAMIAPLMPLRSGSSAPLSWRGVAAWGVSIAGFSLVVAAVLILRSLGACVALTCALAWRWRTSWMGALPVIAGVSAVVALAITRGLDLVRLRVHAYTLTLLDWTAAPITGHGLNSFPDRLPTRAINDYSGGVWTPAHSDPLQWVYETGVPGLVILTGFLVAQRQAFTGRYAPAAVALLLVACVEFPFHAVTTGLTGAVILGLLISSTGA